MALVRPLVRVNTHVPFQSTRFTKALLAHITFVRFLVRVNTHVGFQTTRLSKTLLANTTFVRFLFRVNTHVNLQMTSLTKAHLAHIAFVRFLVRVNTHMYGQEGWISKHLLAHIALVLPSLPLHSFRVFPRLMILLHDIVTRHAHEQTPQSLHVFVSFSLFFSRNTTFCPPHHHHRLYVVFRAFRVFNLSSAPRRHR